MATFKHRWRRIALLAVFALAACSSDPSTTAWFPTRTVPTLPPTLAAPDTTAPNASSQTDTGWLAGAHGIELRQLHLPTKNNLGTFALTVVRLDPSIVRLRVAYAPDAPLTLDGWFRARAPLLAVNGGFFTETNQSTALVVSDGVTSGTSYEGFGGMFSIGADGALLLRSLRDQPYDQAEAPQQAIQSFPMLVFPGGEVAPVEEDGARARRTAIARDSAGRLLVIVSPSSQFSLRGFAEFLAASDLGIDCALNLDGGASTSLYVNDGPAQVQIDSFDRLPMVLLAEPL